MNCKCENQKYEWLLKTVEANSAGLDRAISEEIALVQSQGWQYVHGPKFLEHEGNIVAVLSFRRKDNGGANDGHYSGA